MRDLDMGEIDPVQWATAEAERLRGASGDKQYHGSAGPNWVAAAPHAIEAQAEASGALEFLRRYAKDTDLYRAATDGLGTKMAAYKYLGRVATILDQFVAVYEAGLLTTVPYEVSARVEAATDIMEQVELLLKDRTIHPAAPIVLTGAALEELLRSLWHQAGTPPLTTKPGIGAYATGLQATGLLTRQDVKDITAWAGLRNDAAHGDFSTLSFERARLMADAVNLFMQRHAPRP